MPMPAAKWPILIDGFLRYTRRYLQRSFHTIYLYGDAPTLPEGDTTPLIVCMNHSSWWDVLTPFFIERELFGWDYYGVIDAQQLERYRIFARMGMIGVDRTSLAGAREFLQTATTLLKGRRRSLWLTPQGAMVSNHLRPISFQPGLAHLAARLETFTLVTVALHYDFWDERLPEAFVSISPPRLIQFSEQNWSIKSFTRQAEQTLQMLLDDLLSAVEARDAGRFRPLLRGRSGTSGVYDLFRATAARLQGRRFTPEHGQVVTPQWREQKQVRERDAETGPARSDAVSSVARQNIEVSDEERET